jgi:hypothetical protein
VPSATERITRRCRVEGRLQRSNLAGPDTDLARGPSQLDRKDLTELRGLIPARQSHIATVENRSRHRVPHPVSPAAVPNMRASRHDLEHEAMPTPGQASRPIGRLSAFELSEDDVPPVALPQPG